MQNDLRVLSDSELDAVCGGMINLASKLGPGFHGGPRNTYGGASGVGHGDTIDSGTAGAWGTINNNLPGGSVGQGRGATDGAARADGPDDIIAATCRWAGGS